MQTTSGQLNRGEYKNNSKKISKFETKKYFQLKSKFYQNEIMKIENINP